MKPKITSTVGLDIGSYSVKCVEVVQKADRIALQSIWILPIASNKPEVLSKTLKTMFDSMSSFPRKVRISVAGPSVLIRKVQMPRMTSEELKSAIRFEAERHIPFSIDDCILDFQKLNESADHKTMSVLLVAVKKDYLVSRIKLLSELGVDADIIDTDAFCTINAYQLLGSTEEVKSYGVLNIGHKLSSFAIMHEKLPYFVREIPFGGSKVTEMIMQKRNVSEEEADQFKINGLPEGAEDLREATHKGLEPLVNELKHSIDYYENEVGEEFAKIFISGGGSKAYDTYAYLSEELGKEVVAWDNCKKFARAENLDVKYLELHASELNVAYGLALRGLKLEKLND